MKSIVRAALAATLLCGVAEARAAEDEPLALMMLEKNNRDIAAVIADWLDHNLPK